MMPPDHPLDINMTLLPLLRVGPIYWILYHINIYIPCPTTHYLHPNKRFTGASANTTQILILTEKIEKEVL